MPLVADAQGHLHPNFVAPLRLLLDPAGLGILPRVEAAISTLTHPETVAQIPPSIPVQVTEVGAGQSKHYIVRLPLQKLTLRGTQVGDGIYAGLIQIGDRFETRGYVMSDGGNLVVSHDIDVKIAGVQVTDTVNVAGVVREAWRAGQMLDRAGFTVGTGGALVIGLTTPRGNVVKIDLSALPAVASTNGSTSPSVIFNSGIGVDF